MYQKIDDILNPILVKELRQGMLNRVYIGLINILLAVLFFGATGMLIATGDSYGQNAKVGEWLFIFVTAVLNYSTICLIPLGLMIRLMFERRKNNADLQYITTLTPGAHVRGKLFSNVALVLLLYALSVPFLVLAQSLQGTDSVAMVVSLAIGFLAAVVSVMLAIVIGSWHNGAVANVLSAVAYFVVSIFAATGCMMFTVEGLFQDRVLTRIFDNSFAWSVFAVLVIDFIFLMFWLYSLALAMYCSASEDRFFPVRFVSALWIVVSGLLWTLCGIIFNAFIFLAFWLIGVAVLALFIFLVAISERDGYSQRMLESFEKKRWYHFLTFPLHSNAAAGMTWSVLVLLLAFAWIGIMGSTDLFTEKKDEIESATQLEANDIYFLNESAERSLSLQALFPIGIAVTYVFAAYIFFYGCLARLFIRLISKRHRSSLRETVDAFSLTWMLSLIFYFGVVILVFAICFLADTRRFDESPTLHLTNPLLAVENVGTGLGSALLESGDHKNGYATWEGVEFQRLFRTTEGSRVYDDYGYVPPQCFLKSQFGWYYFFATAMYVFCLISIFPFWLRDWVLFMRE